MSETVQDIIDYVDRKYPNQETDANKIKDLQVIYKELFNRIQSLTDQYETYDAYTIANQFTYILPTRCKIYTIRNIQVSQDTRANINLNTVWNDCKYAGLGTKVDNGYFYTRVSDAVFGLTALGRPVTTTDLVIKIFYYKVPETLTAVTDVLELDERYTNLLRYALIQAIASQGSNPDTEIADYYQRKYDEELVVVLKDIDDRFDEAPVNYVEVQERW